MKTEKELKTEKKELLKSIIMDLWIDLPKKDYGTKGYKSINLIIDSL